MEIVVTCDKGKSQPCPEGTAEKKTLAKDSSVQATKFYTKINLQASAQKEQINK